ncbi:hypothetical protein GW930_02785 [Candidatus Saccharibacteria bacterium]|nr:hypothetical protein [Candidatus Saccharibacteria bacterium]
MHKLTIDVFYSIINLLFRTREIKNPKGEIMASTVLMQSIFTGIIVAIVLVSIAILLLWPASALRSRLAARREAEYAKRLAVNRVLAEVRTRTWLESDAVSAILARMHARSNELVPHVEKFVFYGMIEKMTDEHLNTMRWLSSRRQRDEFKARLEEQAEEHREAISNAGIDPAKLEADVPIR